MVSRPARGGWIEIFSIEAASKALYCPAPHGAGGLKLRAFTVSMADWCPAPHGAGGCMLALTQTKRGSGFPMEAASPFAAFLCISLFYGRKI